MRLIWKTKGLESLDKTVVALGIMYTTWERIYELLPDFGDLAPGVDVSRLEDGPSVNTTRT
jgi:hypothetical protein